ncbi:pilin [Patescibacteria group bacterium]|nr:pilin [Patescibacteria group bacterium]
MRKIVVVTIALMILGSLRIPAAQAIECDGFGIPDCDNAEMLFECPGMCIALCTELLAESDQIIDHPDYCVTCAKVSLLPIGGSLVTLMAGSACTVAAGEAMKQAMCDKGPGGCCIETVSNDKVSKFDKPCKEEKETCAGEPGARYSCCLCTGTDPNVGDMVSTERETFDSCEKTCKEKGLTINKSFGAGNLPKSASANAPTPTALASVNALCFTRAECATKEYGGSPKAFREGYGCPSDKGRCIAPEPQIPLSIPLGNVATVQGLRGYIAAAFQYGISIVAIFAAVMFVYGGFRYMFGSAFGDIKRGKEIMIDAGVGLLLVLGSYTILWTVNPATLELKRLEVFMINKQLDINSKWCSNLKAIMGNESLMFADAGESPNYVSPEGTPYVTLADDTRCNVEYYAKGLGTNRCFGRSCEPLKGFACVYCVGEESKMAECAGKKGYACAKANFSGMVTYTDGRYVEEIVMFTVCNDAVDKELENIDSFLMVNNIHKFKDATLQGDEGDSRKQGKQSFSFSLTPEDIADEESECKDEGGVFGFALGIQYNDPGIGFVSFVSETAGEGGAFDEFAAVGKDSCGGASTRFSGYVEKGASRGETDGDGDENSADMEVAIMCGISSNRKAFWTLDDLRSAAGVGSNPELLFCDLHLESGNAPVDVTSGSSYIKIGDPLRFTCGK